MARMLDTFRMRQYLLFLCFILMAHTGFSQNLQRYNWYFGNSTQAIRFNRTSAKPVLVTKAIPFGTGGSATASDPSNANLLFYTDGQLVYDAAHSQMPAGSGLNANSSANQPVAICPVPGAASINKYFIFTNTANFTTGGSISVSVVDMGLFGNAAFPSPALGDLESKNQPVPGLAARSEAMSIVPHANGTDFWLLTQQVSSQNFSATLINAASYTGTFVTTNTSGLALPTTAANFSYHTGKNKVAVSAQDTNTDAIILDFNPNTGVFAFDRYIFNSGLPTVTSQSIYDIEWSITGDFLYLSRFGEPGVAANLLQYDYQNPATTLTSVLPAPVFRSFGVQMGPDSLIYHLYQSVSGGPVLLGTISKPDTIASQVNYKSAQLTATSFAGNQFPAFAPKSNVNLLVNFTFIGTCQNNNTTFFPDIQPGADSVRWDFGDASGSNDWSPVHKFGQPQTFNVTLTAYYQGQNNAASLPVTIQTFPLKLQLVQDTTACRSEFPPPRGSSSPKQFSVKVKVVGGNASSYQWSNGDTGPILTPDSAGYYYVVVSDGSGCSTYAGVNVKEYGLQDQRSNVWYFGNKAGIDFNVRPPKALSNSAMNAPEGCAIICDRNGKAIFYTDGNNVYNKNDLLIASAIGGDPLASQSAIIVPVPGDETLYYIFTNEAINGTSTNTVKYSLFDIKQNGGLGAVVIQDQTLFSKSTERITASGQWLVIHEYGNNTFRVYSITPAGIGDPVLTAIGSDHPFTSPSAGEGYMKLGPKNTIAVALSQPGSNWIELFHLNDSTGKLSQYRKIDMKQPTGEVYGVEFSPGGNKVYATVKGTPTPSEIFEYFIDSIGKPYFKQKVVQPAAELGALQMGPNGQIYMAINGSAVLGTIQPTDDTTRLSVINMSGFNLAAGTVSQLGLPNFIQQISNATGGPAIDLSGICLGDSTRFIGTATDAIDKFLWFFGDGGSDTQSSPVHLYATVGTYNVSMNLTNRCGLDTTLVRPVTIFAPPKKPTIPGAAALCNGPVTLDANTGNLPGFTYLWSDGKTSQINIISQQAIISVTITDVNGCTSNGQSLIADNQPQLVLGPDQTLCQNSFTLALNAQNPGATFAWTVNGGSPTSAQSRPIDTTLPGTFTYQVIVTDPITTCTTTDQVILTIIASPQFILSGTNPTGCNLANGILTLTLQTTAPPTGPYSYFMTGPNGFNQQGIDQLAPQIINFNALKAGIYSGVLNDQISGCTISQSFGLSDAPFTATALGLAPNCDPVAIQVTTVGVGAFPLQYQITNNGNGQITGPTGGIATPVFTTSPVSQGTYTIQISDASSCIFNINNFAVNPNPPLVITVTPNICAAPPTITAAGGTTYAWSGTGTIVGATNGPTIQVSGQGQFTYTVTASSVGTCPTTQNAVVVLDNAASDFTQSDLCQNTVVLSATPTGNYTYRWYRSGVFQPALLGQTISLGLPENGASYQSEALNTLNGCAYRSPSHIVNVLGVVDAGLLATPACDDNKPFTVTATTSASGVTYGWFRDNAPINGTTSSISESIAGVYKVEISKSSCKATAQLTITKAPLPVGKLPSREIICNDPENKDPKTNQVDLDPGNFSRYDWFKNELNINYTQRVLTASSQGKFKVDITNSFGCLASDETEVLNECLPKIDVPNAFRPGSTIPENKEFYIFSFFITDENFQIFMYNRWGELVYSSADRYFKWNGGYNNSLSQPLPGGSYAFVIRYVSTFHPERGVQEKRGGVALLR